MKRWLAIALLTGASFAQGGTTSGNIFPATSGQQLGNNARRWTLNALDVDVKRSLTCNGLPCSNLTVPQGYIWQGPWDSSQAYQAYDTVSYNGSAYVAKASSLNVAPGTDSAKWALMALAAQGPKGDPGLPYDPNCHADGSGNLICSKVSIRGTPSAGTDAVSVDYVSANASGDPAVKYAQKQTGATPEEKITAAATALGGNTGLVWVPSTMTGGYSSSVALPSRSFVQDFRGCYYNVYSLTVECNTSNMTSGMFQLYTVAEPTPVTAKTYNGFQIFQEVFSGGINQGTPTNIKSNFNTAIVSQRSYTPGQHTAFSSTNMCASAGDCFAGAFQTYQFGSTDAAGDEGMKAISAYSYQGSEVFTATVSSVAGNVINYTSPYAEFSRGEKRYLIVTNRAVYSTGTVSAISTVTVTGSGTSWGSLCAGGTAPCDPTNLFFSLDGGNAAGTQLYVVRILHITSNTSFTITFDRDNGGSWQGDDTTGTYKIFKGSTVTGVAKTGAVTVADGTQFQASDAVQMPLGNNLQVVAVAAQVKKYVPGGGNTAAIYASNIGPRQFPYAFYGYGDYSRGIYLYNAASPYNVNNEALHVEGYNNGLSMKSTTDNATIYPLRLARNTALADFTMQFLKNGDELDFGPAAIYKFAGTDATHISFYINDGSGVPRFIVTSASYAFNNGKRLSFYSDNQGTEKAYVRGDTGEAGFAYIKAVTGVIADGGGLKHKRITTGSIAQSASAAVTVTWGTAFANASYTVSCSVTEATASTSTLRVHHIESVAADTTVVRVVNDDGAAAHTGTLQCIALHD